MSGELRDALKKRLDENYAAFISSLNKSIHKHNKLNGLSTLHKTPLPLKNGAVFLYGFWSP